MESTPENHMMELRWPGWYPILLTITALIASVFLFLFDPETSAGFLPCPLRAVTGLLCPGCGAQRAMHDLLHGRILEAFAHNPVLVLSIPVLGLQWMLPRLVRSARRPEWDNRVVYTWLIVLIGWGIIRNLFEFSHVH